jgi:hypothetical protein
MKRYYVDFYDGFDGWGLFGFFTDRLFDDLEEAKKCCDNLQAKLNQSSKDFGEHYGVIDKELNMEIYCTQHRG